MRHLLALDGPVYRAAGPVLGGLVLIVVLGVGSSFWIYTLTLVAIYAIVVVGLNALVGYLGLISFAQTAFMAVGGYGFAILATRGHWNPWAALGAAVALALLLAVVIGVPLLRLRGHYLTMASFALALAFYSLANGAGFTGGAIGISAVPALSVGSLSFASPVPMLLLGSVVLAGALALVARLRTSHVGRAWRTIATREDVAASLGVPALKLKLLGLAIGAVLAAVAGALYVQYTSFVSPDLYSATVVINLFIMLFVGGRGRTFGPVLGAAIVVVLPELFAGLSSIEGIVFDLALLAIVLVLPDGLLGGVRRVWARLWGRAPQELPRSAEVTHAA
jgi:branched-chain amino acid transport system permease protein